MRRTDRRDDPTPRPTEGNGTAGPRTPAARPGRLRRIPADAVLRLHELQALLGLPDSTLARELRLGRLRSAKRAGCRWILGSWVREWLEGGEVHRGPPPNGSQ